LGIEKSYDYTPQVYRRIVFAATQSPSFQDASQSLVELAELPLLPKRIWRAAKRIGEERIAERAAAAEAYAALPLPARRTSPVAQVPQVACVQMDGGRFQVRERENASPEADADANAGEGHWREYKAGVLLSMTSEVHAEDPCPELPAAFADPGKMREMAREIKGFTHDAAVRLDAVSLETKEPVSAEVEARAGRPEVLVKSVVATSGDVDAFGLLLVSAAYERGFHAADRKAFLGDGSATNWSVWREHFSHYTPILDFVHALMYVYAAAMTGRPVEEGWFSYRDWAQWLWSGEIERLLAALEQRQQELGEPDKQETGTPRAIVATSLGYLKNHRERMRYAEFRRQGLPITTSAIESTIKQINRRIKGTEKFWDEGADPMLQLVADRLTQTNAPTQFWTRRLDRLIHASCYHQAS
jgi:hypothetical protein